ncbi:uncharacterized protein LOC109728522 [Ananas comosus]|uniref:Uncharacterized protein LOC109728522 n=1 Tax=Ananas comosus TaxID=4615 RepID=A0A6P5HMG3_ANACO|nr:uncharacterized protein LOC109728522 [Ananas comosus]
MAHRHLSPTHVDRQQNFCRFFFFFFFFNFLVYKFKSSSFHSLTPPPLLSQSQLYSLTPPRPRLSQYPNSQPPLPIPTLSRACLGVLLSQLSKKRLDRSIMNSSVDSDEIEQHESDSEELNQLSKDLESLVASNEKKKKKSSN